MKKSILILLTLIFTSNFLFAQENPVSWTYKAEKIGDKEYNLVIEGDIKEGWFVYSQYLESDAGPVKTSFDFSKNKNIELVGKNEESGGIKKIHDAVFDMNVIKFAHKAIFTQKIKLTAPANSVAGTVEYMCCDDGMCLPPKQISFKIDL
jgi:hypothetical protein